MIKIGDWLSEGWALIKDDIVTFAVAALLVGLIGSLTLGICLPALSVGLFMMVFKKMRGETIAIGDVFQGFSKFGPAFVAAIVLAVAVGLVGVVLNFIPVLGQIAASLLGVVVGGAMFYLLPLIATTDISGIDAIKASLEKTKPQIVMYSVTAFVYSLVSGLGAIACFVGQFVTWPLTIAAMALAYRDNFGLPGAAPGAPAASPAAPMPPQAPPAAPPPSPKPPTPQPPTGQ